MRRVPGVRYREILVPSTLADYGIGVELESGSDGASGEHPDHARPGIVGEGADRPRSGASGWITLLYSREPRDDWSSRWRCVAFARMPLETREDNGLAPAMYWETLRGFLDGADRDGLRGTVTVTRNTSFGSLAGPDSAGCEMRVSWTPLEDIDGRMDAGAQVVMWAMFIRSAAVAEEEPSVDR